MILKTILTIIEDDNDCAIQHEMAKQGESFFSSLEQILISLRR